MHALYAVFTIVFTLANLSGALAAVLQPRIPTCRAFDFCNLNLLTGETKANLIRDKAEFSKFEPVLTCPYHDQFYNQMNCVYRVYPFQGSGFRTDLVRSESAEGCDAGYDVDLECIVPFYGQVLKYASSGY
ncbi:hypothetical protein FRB99_002507 [Tulasnella sp. 403]|nr:hypothetical protein FRB99_002507 [Tulasnella sp. 403]